MTIRSFEFAELGEGYDGEYDPLDPTDEELLRLDYLEDGEELESYCTNLPVSLSDADRQRALDFISGYFATHDLTPRTVVTIFSHMDPSWLETGIPDSIRDLFGLDNDNPKV